MNIAISGNLNKDSINGKKLTVHKVLRPGYKLYIGSECNDGRPITESWRYKQAIKLGIPIIKEKVDEIISANLLKWKIGRLTYIDRAIIRFATYELYYTETPHEIVINEALNLTRKFSDEGDSKMVGFTNKVLDNIKKYLKK